MTAKNNIPAGYKDSAVGIIPQEWEVKYLGDLLVRLANGLTYDVSVTSGYPVSRIETISSGEINYLKVGYIDNVSGCESYKMQKGDILYSHINSLAHIGKVAYYDGKQELYHGMNLLLMRVNDKVDSNYLYAYLLTSQAKHIAQVIAKPAVNQASISTSDIRKIKLTIPPMVEQRKIAEILGVWNEAIEKQSRLIEKLELRKRALMQRLLTGRTRLPGFTTPWQKRRMKDCFEHINGTSNGCEYLPMTISARLGLISQNDKFDRVIAGDSLKKYTHIQKGDFAYNKGNSNLYEMGCIYRLKEQDAVVPFVYICFRPKQNVIGEFYQHFFINHGLDRQLKRIITSGARGDGLLNVDKTDFFELEIVYPPIAEQKAIAEVLTAADNEIDIHRKKLDALRLQKRGLMQLLLTGKTRVKI